MSKNRSEELYLGSLKRKTNAEIDIQKKQEQMRWEQSLNAQHKLAYHPPQRISYSRTVSSRLALLPNSTLCMPSRSKHGRREAGIRKSNSFVPTESMTRTLKELKETQKKNDPHFRSMNNLPPIINENIEIQPVSPISATVAQMERLNII